MSTIKGIVLAGGLGTRLLPMTRITNKHLLPVYNKPMIYYPINTLVSAGIQDIMIITGTESAGDFINYLGDGRDFNVNLTYRVQHGCGGIADALSLCKSFAGNNPVVVMLGDNILEDNIKPYVEEYANSNNHAVVFLKEVEDANRFGVASISGDRILKIIEKPKEPETNLAVIGLYFYNHWIWDIISSLKPSARGELEITDVNNWYIEKQMMKYYKIKGYWTDAGTPESLYRASSYIRLKTSNLKN